MSAAFLPEVLDVLRPEDFRTAHPDLAWNPARDPLNRIVHGDRAVVPDMLIEIPRVDLPQLPQQIDALLKDAPP